MGNTNSAQAARDDIHAMYDEIATTDDVATLTIVLRMLLKSDANRIRDNLTALTQALYYNACVKCLAIVEHCLDTDPNAHTKLVNWWKIRYLYLLTENYAHRLTPELLVLIKQAEEDLAARNGREPKPISQSPQAQLALAIYHDDVDTVTSILAEHPRLFNLNYIMTVASSPNHEGNITAPKVTAAFPELTKRQARVEDVINVCQKAGLEVVGLCSVEE